jgi:hypothetical protein
MPQQMQLLQLKMLLRLVLHCWQDPAPEFMSEYQLQQRQTLQTGFGFQQKSC